MKTIKALISFAYVDENGITTYTSGQVYEVSNEIATQMIAVGYAEEYSSGGGGSSDFSTATITVNPNHKAVVSMPVLREDGIVGIAGITGTHQFILGEQGTSIMIEVLSDDATITITGDYREVVEEGEVVEQIATGDCTITIS